MGLWKVWQPMGTSFGDLDNDGLLDTYHVPADAAIEIAQGEPGFVVIPRKVVKLGP